MVGGDVAGVAAGGGVTGRIGWNEGWFAWSPRKARTLRATISADCPRRACVSDRCSSDSLDSTWSPLRAQSAVTAERGGQSIARPRNSLMASAAKDHRTKEICDTHRHQSGMLAVLT